MLKKLVEVDKEHDSVRNGMPYPLPRESHLNRMKGQDLPIPPAYKLFIRYTEYIDLLCMKVTLKVITTPF